MVVTMAEQSEDEKIRMQCEAREIYEKRERTWQSILEEEKARADTEKVRADKEKARADTEKARADKEKARADKAEAELAAVRKQH